MIGLLQHFQNFSAHESDFNTKSQRNFLIQYSSLKNRNVAGSSFVLARDYNRRFAEANLIIFSKSVPSPDAINYQNTSLTHLKREKFAKTAYFSSLYNINTARPSL